MPVQPTERDRVTLDVARANRLELDFDDTTISPPTFVGTRVFDDLRRRRARAVHRLDAVLPHLGHSRQVPRSPHRPRPRRRGCARCTTMPMAMLDKIVADHWFRPKAVVGFWPANADGDDIVVFTDETRTVERARLHGLRQQSSSVANTAIDENLCLSDFVAPVESRVDRLDRRVRRDRRSRGDRDRRALRSATTTTTPRSCSRRSPTDSPRPSPSGCTSACAESCGATRPTSRSRPTDLLQRVVPGHPPGTGLPEPARPHREGHAVRTARCHGGDRGRAHRVARDVAGLVGVRHVLRPPRDRSTSASARSASDQLESYADRKGWTIDEAETHLAPILDEPEPFAWFVILGAPTDPI